MTDTFSDEPTGLHPDRMPNIQVLIAGQSRLFGDALGRALGDYPGLDVVPCGSFQGLNVEPLGELRPDVLLLESGPCQAELVAAVAALHAACPLARILILAASVTDETKASCLKAGAIGCVSRECSIDEVVEAIRIVSGGGMLFEAAIVHSLLRQPPAPPLPSLRPREVDVLRTIAMGCSAEEAAAHLAISPHTVRTHLKLALRKLGARSKVEGIVIALRRGLIEMPT